MCTPRYQQSHIADDTIVFGYYGNGSTFLIEYEILRRQEYLVNLSFEKVNTFVAKSAIICVISCNICQQSHAKQMAIDVVEGFVWMT